MASPCCCAVGWLMRMCRILKGGTVRKVYTSRCSVLLNASLVGVQGDRGSRRKVGFNTQVPGASASATYMQTSSQNPKPYGLNALGFGGPRHPRL